MASASTNKKPESYPAVKVQQWLPDWENVPYDETKTRAEPKPHFFLFSMKASDLRRLSGVHRRQAKTGKARQQETGIQRGHDDKRSKEIMRYIRSGYPWSTLSEAKRKSGDHEDLRMPGWLPTAIVVNLVRAGEHRREGTKPLQDKNAIKVIDENGHPQVMIPDPNVNDATESGEQYPIEIIDGQHRLLAFESDEALDFDLPVVAFEGLDLTWQAYLFWTINVKPKKINASLAFDLYPLLRTQDWIDRGEDHPIYRETRAQEIAESLWALPASPWHERINMLGERGKKGMVTQAAWIRSLMATLVKRWQGPGIKIGGLFASSTPDGNAALGWTRAQQVALIIAYGQSIREGMNQLDQSWKTKIKDEETGPNAIFGSKFNLLNTDQGIRCILGVLNDFCFEMVNELKLPEWQMEPIDGPLEPEDLDAALKSLKKQGFWPFIQDLGNQISGFDWRTSSAPGLSEEQRLQRGAYRGSSGYKELKQQVIKFLASEGTGKISSEANHLCGMLGLEFGD